MRHRLALATLLLGVLAVGAATFSVYGLARTQGFAAEALAAQRRIEAFGAVSARVSEWLLVRSLAPAGERADDGPLASLIGDLDRLVAADVTQAPTEADRAVRARQAVTVARIRGQVEGLRRALDARDPEALQPMIAFYASQVPPLIAAQAQADAARRDIALQEMETLRQRLIRVALAIGVAAPLLLGGVYLALIRPLFRRLATATAAARILAAGGEPPARRGHDELGLMLARLRLGTARVARERARLEATVAERTAALSAANARLSRADTDRRRFFADVGHELRTPLTVILGEAELAMAEAEGTVAAGLATIRGRALRLFRRIEDLLRIARSESGQLELHREPVDLAAVVQAALADTRPVLARAGVAAGASLPPLEVKGDADWLRQVFSGLLENAGKYAGRGASVAIEGQCRGGRAIVTVTDDGPGLPAEAREAVFERFGRGVAPAPGFGVGLALARWVVKSHGGRLVAEGPEGGGLRLVVDLPLAESEGP